MGLSCVVSPFSSPLVTPDRSTGEWHAHAAQRSGVSEDERVFRPESEGPHIAARVRALEQILQQELGRKVVVVEGSDAG